MGLLHSAQTKKQNKKTGIIQSEQSLNNTCFLLFIKSYASLKYYYFASQPLFITVRGFGHLCNNEE